ncbi:MAG TPA: hypothetical protein VLA78_10295 [Paracoccaceae bacterium]|jgi:archaellum biogenesis protein FlaJ (TadC family)|nr:hypothetical protein [Paracoccaceae bacterium]
MTGEDGRDRKQATMMLAVLAVAGLVVAGLLVWAVLALMPQAQAWADATFGGGLGLKTAAIIAAAVSFVALIALTVTAGDGLLGEIQFVIPGFFLFFLFFWLMTAWVF